ncbi:MAG: phytanoyl-CoA dioxygenase family protein [Bryobacterales bacterium]|nr:phytanoyl-CoA dioxygenase family protein [Bryobacterales bacterium]
MPTARIRTPDFWLALNPALTIGDTRPKPWDAPIRPTAEDIAGAVRNYRGKGFLELPRALCPMQAHRMRQAIENLWQNGWHPVWSFVYDDFWSIGQSQVLRQLLPQLLDGPYALLPHVFTHYVEPGPGNAGWAPHIDAGEDGVASASIWIPLSPARLTNGCMYLVKRGDGIEEIVDDARERGHYSSDDLMTILRSVRALPANPGDLLAWDERILHWGTPWESGTEPRISIALEFTPATGAETLIDPLSPPPPFEARLQIIARAIQTYSRFDPRVEIVARLAENLVASTRA